MSKYALCSLLLLFFIPARGQTGIVRTIAGGGTTLMDGVPATNAHIASSVVRRFFYFATDPAGNLYICDTSMRAIRKVDAASGIITTIAGTGVRGYSGDGGPAVSAETGTPSGICADTFGNCYFADSYISEMRVRKVNASTGIITTIAGGGTYYAEGIPATNAHFSPNNSRVRVDRTGNVYIQDVNVIYKVAAATGIINRVAGGGSLTTDGVPATASSLYVRNFHVDANGNIYVGETSARIRKVDGLTGIISTIAAESAEALATDASSNIYFFEGGIRIRKIAAGSGAVTTVAGGGTIVADGTQALCNKINDPGFVKDVYVDAGNNIYYSHDTGGADMLIRKVNFLPTGHADSFRYAVDRTCAGAQITIMMDRYYPTASVKTYFGDGVSGTSSFTFLCNAVATINHHYNSPGTYTIKHVLYIGMTAVDSIHYSYNYTACTTIPVKIYLESNSNCTKDSTEPYIFQPILIEVDSNGTAIDTISATSGFYYDAYGHAGDAYSFKAVQTPAGLYAACGFITDTLGVAGSMPSNNYLGLSCTTTAGFDLLVKGYAVCQPWDQTGVLFIANTFCSPSGATGGMEISPKYVYASADPMPASLSGNSIAWNLTGISVVNPPVKIYYKLFNNSVIGLLSFGDTVHTRFGVTPIAGDIVPSNNTELLINTVVSAHDPNDIVVAPGGCLPTGVDKLQYTIHFENTGNDTAFNIYIVDTLPVYVDQKSLRIEMSSAAMDVYNVSDGGFNIVKFDFPGINLLDSSHHGLCDGAVIFTVKLNAGIAEGTVIANRASIYFDHNLPVLTNSAESVKGCPVAGIKNAYIAEQVLLQPNPAGDVLTVYSSDYTELKICNALGQQMIAKRLYGTQTKVDVSTLPAGIYYATLKGEYSCKTDKFVKL